MKINLTLELQICPGIESTKFWNSSLSDWMPQWVCPELMASWKEGLSEAMLSGVYRAPLRTSSISTGSATWINSWISSSGSGGGIFLLPLASPMGFCSERLILALWLASTKSNEERRDASLQLGCAPLSNKVRTVSASG